MYKHVILTVGTSFFSAFNIFGKEARNFEGMLFEKGQMSVADPAAEQVILSTWQKMILALVKDISLIDKSISAEFSVLTLLHQQDRISPQTSIYLFYTDTVAGRFAANSLKLLIQYAFKINVTLKKIENFDFEDEVQLNASMGKFMIDIDEILNRCESNMTCFAPIGGYKIIISYSYIAAAIHNMHIIYLPESGQVLHTIPPVPVYIEKNNNQLNHLISHFNNQLVLSYDTFTATLQQKIIQHTAYFDVKHNAVYLNPIGQYLRYQLYKGSDME